MEIESRLVVATGEEGVEGGVGVRDREMQTSPRRMVSRLLHAELVNSKALPQSTGSYAAPCHQPYGKEDGKVHRCDPVTSVHSRVTNAVSQLYFRKTKGKARS